MQDSEKIREMEKDERKTEGEEALIKKPGKFSLLYVQIILSILIVISIIVIKNFFPKLIVDIEDVYNSSPIVFLSENSMSIID